MPVISTFRSLRVHDFPNVYNKYQGQFKTSTSKQLRYNEARKERGRGGDREERLLTTFRGHVPNRQPRVRLQGT